MSVWVCLPSARPVAEVNARMQKWRDQGYKIALWRDDKYAPSEAGQAFAVRADLIPMDLTCDVLFLAATYPGYSQTVNLMARHILTKADLSCDWIVAIGDDTDPDPTKRADEIAAELSNHFRDEAWPKCWSWPAGKTLEFAKQDGTAVQEKQGLWSAELATIFSTFGVCQPTGDDWRDSSGRIIERIAGSPWLGREWCLRINGGRGPLWPEYTHCFADEELQHVATRLGVFWQRPDLTHYHDHWARPRGNPADMPAFLSDACSPAHWQKYGAIFKERLAAGFPGHEPLAITSHVR